MLDALRHAADRPGKGRAVHGDRHARALLDECLDAGKIVDPGTEAGSAHGVAHQCQPVGALHPVGDLHQAARQMVPIRDHLCRQPVFDQRCLQHAGVALGAYSSHERHAAPQVRDVPQTGLHGLAHHAVESVRMASADEHATVAQVTDESHSPLPLRSKRNPPQPSRVAQERLPLLRTGHL